MYGRRLLTTEVNDNEILPNLQRLPTMTVKKDYVICHRCNSKLPKQKVGLPAEHYYCDQCLNLGRVSTLEQFWYLPEPNQFPEIKDPLTWQGQLSMLQKQCSTEICQALAKHERHLLWAVTGAGKTEMLFQAISQALQRGERVAIASPRVDVCLELYPRLQAAFQHHEICLLHGRQKQPYFYAQLTICTTHQLLRFFHAFDNLIIDEVDAFPFAANQQLLFAADQAVKKTGGCLYLTATPSKELLAQTRTKKLAITYLPLRYHGHLLPTIQLKLAVKWRTQLKQQRLPQSLVLAIKNRINKKRRFLLFVPHVADLPHIAAVLKKIVSDTIFMTVHAADPQRLEKVQAMRDQEIQFLVTTSILERGVTFPEIDVLVLGADDAVFSSAALVQIAGRAGRSAKRPTGDVLFWVSCYTRNVRAACQQIKFVNRKGQALQ